MRGFKRGYLLCDLVIRPKKVFIGKLEKVIMYKQSFDHVYIKNLEARGDRSEDKINLLKIIFPQNDISSHFFNLPG